MKTTKQDVVGEVCIWAVPRTEWEISQSEDKKPFHLELYCSNDEPYREAAVQLYAEEVVLTCPAGIDMVQAAVDTLHGVKEKEVKAHATRMNELDDRIAALLRLTHITPEGENIVPLKP
jgi:hypothetical protein